MRETRTTPAKGKKVPVEQKLYQTKPDKQLVKSVTETGMPLNKYLAHCGVASRGKQLT